MPYGDVATWVSAVGTVGALVFTAFTLRRQIDRERRHDDDQRRMYAKRVSLSIVEQLLGTCEVVNGSYDNIYMIAVYLEDKSSGAIIASSGEPQSLMTPNERRRFSLIPADAALPVPRAYRCFAQFTDGNGYGCGSSGATRDRLPRGLDPSGLMSAREGFGQSDFRGVLSSMLGALGTAG